MKKTFQLQDEKKKPERVIEAIKHEIRKYIKRERSKKLPEGVDYWDLVCRFGLDSDRSQPMKSTEIITALDKVLKDDWSQCYVEIISKEGIKRKETNSAETVEIKE